MRMPAWTDAQHPIGRRERQVWRKLLRRWWWLGMLPVAFVLLTALCSFTGNLPLLLQSSTIPESPEIALIVVIVIVQTVVQSIWNINATVQWVVGVAIGFGSAVTIARERETKNWELLCLTPIPANEIALAKVYVVVWQFKWPLLITTLINLGLILLLAIGIIGGVLLFNVASPDILPPEVPIAAIVLTLLATPFIFALILINAILDVLNNTAIGLAASCWAKTRANAVAFTVVIHFILNTFILGPLYFLLFIGIAFVGGLVALIGISPFGAVVALAVVMAGLFIVFRAGTTVAAIAAARYQLQRLTE